MLNDELNMKSDLNINENEKGIGSNKLLIILPLLISIIILSGFISKGNINNSENSAIIHENSEKGINKIGKVNLLSENDLIKGIIDTVYTDKECWLELRIHEQKLYQHWRNGKVEVYPVSTGNKNLSKGIESRPGLYAIFYKEAHHQSTQFENADMYHFMPFNSGIGFHSINGTGYYGSLGVRPSSHGCIRMKHPDAEKLFKDCDLGTLVLAHRGNYTRTVSFLPENYENNETLTKDQMKHELAENLYNVLEGMYYIKDRKYFAVDPSIIPKSGIYNGYDIEAPKVQKIPRSYLTLNNGYDKLSVNVKESDDILYNEEADQTFGFKTLFVSMASETNTGNKVNSSNDDFIIKKYFNNPIGITPYFPPTVKAPKYERVTSNTSTGTIDN